METKIIGWKNIPLTDKAKSFLKDLPQGICVALRMKHVNSSKEGLPKIQVEYAEKIKSNRPQSLLQELNSEDDRFSSGAQRHWITGDASVIESIYGKIPEGEASVEILDKLPNTYRMLVTEVTESQLTDTEQEYTENYLKRAGQDGNYFYTPNGERVAVRRDVVKVEAGAEPNHTYLEGSYQAEPDNTSVIKKPALSEDMQGA